VKGVQQETQFLKTMNIALAKNKEVWMQKVLETEEQAHHPGPKDNKIKDLEVHLLVCFVSIFFFLFLFLVLVLFC
jgi:hypothetical protein